MKPAALAAGLVALACCAPAQAQSFSELALDGRPDRLQRLVAGAKKEGALTLYTSIPEKDMAVLGRASCRETARSDGSKVDEDEKAVSRSRYMADAYIRSARS